MTLPSLDATAQAELVARGTRKAHRDFNSLPGNPLAGFSRAQAFAPFTGICNFTGQPGMSVPLYWNAQGLPIGTQVIGRFGDEATLFRLAAQLEQARPWAGRRPVVCP